MLSISDGRRKRAALEQRHTAVTQPHGRHVQLDVVHDAFVPGRPLHAAPPSSTRLCTSKFGSTDSAAAIPGLGTGITRGTGLLQRLGPLGPERFRRCEYYHRSRRERRQQARAARESRSRRSNTTRTSGRSR